MNPVTRLWLSIVIVLVVLFGGTAGYVLVEHQSLLDSLYMTVITLTTVGFKEVFPLSQQGQILTILLILVGYAALSVALANLVSLVVGGEFQRLRERSQMKARIEQLNGHVIICGYGRMGAQVTRQLQTEKVPCVAIDNANIHELEEDEILFIEGDATEDNALLAAGLMRARALVTCLSSDADNVYVTLTARELQPHLHIIARADQATTERKLLRAGANEVICPQMIGASQTVNLICRPQVVELLDMASKGVDMEVAQYEVGSDSQLVGKALRESGIRERAGMMVVAIKRTDGAQLFGPGPDEVIRGGDQLVLIGRGGLSDRLHDMHL